MLHVPEYHWQECYVMALIRLMIKREALKRLRRVNVKCLEALVKVRKMSRAAEIDRSGLLHASAEAEA